MNRNDRRAIGSLNTGVMLSKQHLRVKQLFKDYVTGTIVLNDLIFLTRLVLQKDSFPFYCKVIFFFYNRSPNFDLIEDDFELFNYMQDYLEFVISIEDLGRLLETIIFDNNAYESCRLSLMIRNIAFMEDWRGEWELRRN